MDTARARSATDRRRARRFGLTAYCAHVLGRFHEISIETRDIRASVEFYERLGFSQATTGDTWSHPYGVLTDGHIFLGLHQCAFESPALTFVHPEVVTYISELEARGIQLVSRKTDPDVFNQIGLRDPAGQAVVVMEARTYSPPQRRPEETSLCGYFSEFSIPAADFAAVKQFWEPMGFVTTDECDEPYVHVGLTSDFLDIAFHRPRTLDRPMLVFREADMAQRIAALRERGMSFSADLPRGMNPADHALVEAPEGTLLLLTTES